MKKIIKTAFVFTAALALCSFTEKSVELLDDGKLIDLDKAIDIASPGGSAIFNEDMDSDTENSGASDPAKNSVLITVRNESITYNRKQVTGTEELLKKLKMDLKGEMTVSLADDYAEAHVYKSVIKALNDLKKDYEFEFSYE